MIKSLNLFANGKSKTYGLIGKTLKHSYSGKYFEHKFKIENIGNSKYLHFEIDDLKEFPKLIEAHPDLVGLNITIPYKKTIIHYLDEIDRSSRFIGAVNTIKISRKNNKPFLSGYNTDAHGFEKTLFPVLKPHHHKALVLGTGGASRAVVYILRKNGISYLEVTRFPYKSNQIGYDMISEEIIREYNLIINTTPVGMYPNVEDLVNIPYDYLDQNNLLYDLVYNPEETQFLKAAKSKGAATINGSGMFELQAERSWKIWNRKSILPF
ncbi:MAG: shikimate dehydrogenase [Bacteroidetes bacterium HGW-Bacteroidetes-17]|nr:MAG: shikimate dehydrogenase [Bacteroidetes bacterium HGW-Bacteroidetes-17]